MLRWQCCLLLSAQQKLRMFFVRIKPEKSEECTGEASKCLPNPKCSLLLSELEYSRGDSTETHFHVSFVMKRTFLPLFAVKDSSINGLVCPSVSSSGITKTNKDLLSNKGWSQIFTHQHLNHLDYNLPWSEFSIVNCGMQVAQVLVKNSQEQLCISLIASIPNSYIAENKK